MAGKFAVPLQSRKIFNLMEHKLEIEVNWTGKNFCCGWSDEDAGTVVVTAKTLRQLKQDFEESLRLHIEGCVADGDTLPAWLINGDYRLEYMLDTAVDQQAGEYLREIAGQAQAEGKSEELLQTVLFLMERVERRLEALEKSVAEAPL